MKTRILIIIGVIGFLSLFVLDASGFGIPPLQNTGEHFEFIDFQSIYQAGIPIKFILEKTRDSDCNSYNAKITDKDGNFIWGGGAEISCDTTNNSVSIQTKIGYNENHPIIINKSGTYYLEVEFYDKFTKREFTVRHNTAGETLDRTVYSPSLKQQIQSVFPMVEIQCPNEDHILTKRPNDKLACVYPETAKHLKWDVYTNIVLNEVSSNVDVSNYHDKKSLETKFCTANMIEFLDKNSNMFDNNEPYSSPLDGDVLQGLDINPDDMVQCENELYENRNYTRTS